MDELELLKRDWQKREDAHPKLTYDEIYRMIWKRSSSIVKWIMIISILEFALPHLLYLIPGTSKSLEIYDKLGIKNVTTVFFALGYLVIFYFIYQFYSRYREISSFDNSKVLMEKILRTRRTVMHYVIFSLSMLLAMCIMVIVAIYFSDNLYEIFDIPETATKVSPGKLKSSLIISMTIVSVLFVAAMAGIYFLLYGLLLRKLNRNYAELRRLEV
ncbi:MAG: hypothetical protein WBN39_09985 [Flavobacteriaceae bacterium]